MREGGGAKGADGDVAGGVDGEVGGAPAVDPVERGGKVGGPRVTVRRSGIGNR